MVHKMKTAYKNLPVSGASLDLIKIIAVITMLIDHVNHLVFSHASVEAYYIGRLAFPLFCYGVACAMYRTRAENYKYVVGLVALAVLVEPIFTLARGENNLNVLFTLAAGAALIIVMDKLKTWQNNLIFTLGLIATVLPGSWEFGTAGALIPAAFYMVLTQRSYGIFWTIILLFNSNLGPIVNVPDFKAIPDVQLYVSNVAAMNTIVGFFATIPTILVIFLAKFIKSEKRLMPKYFLHIFYPGHIVLLALISLAFGIGIHGVVK